MQIPGPHPERRRKAYGDRVLPGLRTLNGGNAGNYKHQMKVDRQDGDGLDRAIGAWKVQVEIPPDLQARVWRRIQFNAESRRSRWLWLERLAFDVRLAAALPVIALAAGFWLGVRHESDARRDQGRPFELAYVDSLDPYTQAHHEERQ